MLPVPLSVKCPSYASLIAPGAEEPPKEPEIKTAEQIIEMRKTCRLARLFLDTVAEHLQVSDL